ncbi:hypothetical protein [Leptothoe sp. PORK10 BA2]|uniref:hypothetical protein n=1 Tax=Leptothoe sp. PORK10 BA2 TaxID=3110254 RepID=UPI002B1EADC6|nr:hypothetical protein [Leptothoe sp. PORK10 BA2]MEA5463865.1 hypothetical protein [Leptothoe sp. PORK10 BA2]
MAGLFGLFGGNKKQAPQSKEAFFLSEDDAKSLGDIDYMRKEVVIRRTFAKKKGGDELESVKSISASTSKKVGEAVKTTTSSFNMPTFNTPAPTFNTPAPTPAPAPTPVAAAAADADATPAPQETAVSSTPDTSMDMFRSMAKKIRR